MKISDVTNFLGVTSTREKDPELPERPKFDAEVEGDRKVLVSWEAPLRTSYGSSKFGANRTLIVIAVVVGLVLAVMGEFMLLIVIASIFFLRNILSAAPVNTAKHNLNNHGVMYAGQFYGWGDLKHYFFTRSKGAETLCVDTIDSLPGRLFFIIQPEDKAKIQDIMSKYLTKLQEEPKSALDKAFESVTSRISVERSKDKPEIHGRK